MVSEDRLKFLDEIESLKELDHPNLGKVIDIFEDKERFYLICELLSGGSLLEVVSAKGSFSEQEAAKLVKQLLSATACIHRKGMIHGDIKP